MNSIEQHVELTDDVLTVPIPAEWKGKGATLKLVLDEETSVPAEKPKRTGLSKHRGAFAYLPLEQRLEMQKQLDDMRNEWDRPI